MKIDGDVYELEYFFPFRVSFFHCPTLSCRLCLRKQDIPPPNKDVKFTALIDVTVYQNTFIRSNLSDSVPEENLLLTSVLMREVIAMECLNKQVSILK